MTTRRPRRPLVVIDGLLPLPADLAWPLAVALAWAVGEAGHRWTGLPRISLYGLVGFLLGRTQLGCCPRPAPAP